MMKKFNAVLGLTSGLLFLAVSLILFYDVLGRYFFGDPSVWAQSVSQYLILVAVFLGTAYCFQEDGHVNVEILIDRFTPGWKRAALGTGYLMSLVYTLAMLWYAGRLADMSWQLGWRTQGSFPVPSWLLYGVMVFGCVLLVLTIGMKLRGLLRTGKGGGAGA